MGRVQACLLFAALPFAAFSQPAGSQAARISPTLYFPSAPAELESRKTLHARVEQLASGIPSAKPDSLPALLETTEQVLIALQRHAAYLRVHTLEDTADQEARAAADAITADRSVLDSTLRDRLRQVPRDHIATLG